MGHEYMEMKNTNAAIQSYRYGSILMCNIYDILIHGTFLFSDKR